MVQKRPFDAEKTLEVSFKHPRQVGPGDQFMSFAESFFLEDACHAPKISVEYPRGAVEFEPSFPGSISVSSWAISGSSTSEDVQSEPPIHLPFVPGYFSPVRYEDIYCLLCEHPPHKFVSVGPNHQADVPVWDSGAASSSIPNASDAAGDNKIEERLMGTCIVPMPQMELSIYGNEEVGKGRNDCSCEDMGSLRCVRQHIVEAREERTKNIGHEIFVDLGLFDMGEQVADKWSAEEEQLFCEVVFNSPATLDKTFWNYLSVAFPMKTKKELVSYYFNVFMLRRRAEQNRNDLLAIDSDDDEWQGSDGNGDDACLASCHENDLQDNDEYASDETCAVNGTGDFTERNIDDDSKDDSSEVPHIIDLPSLIQPQDQTVWQERFGEEVQEDSSTSCEAGVAAQETQVKTENGDHWCGNCNEECNGYSQGCVLEPCDTEVWHSSSFLH